MKLKNTPIEYQNYYANCREDGIQPMQYDKWQNNHNPTVDNLTRWNNARTAPSLWDKINKDPEYNAILNSRIRKDREGMILSDAPTMGNRSK
jgi:hypothetical protein